MHGNPGINSFRGALYDHYMHKRQDLLGTMPTFLVLPIEGPANAALCRSTARSSLPTGWSGNIGQDDADHLDHCNAQACHQLASQVAGTGMAIDIRVCALRQA